MSVNKIAEEEIRDWMRQIEGWLGASLNGTTAEGQEMIKYEYIPGSARLEQLRYDDGVELCHLLVSYQAKRVALEDGFFVSHPKGAVEIPVGVNGELVFTGCCPMDGIFELLEGCIDL